MAKEFQESGEKFQVRLEGADPQTVAELIAEDERLRPQEGYRYDYVAGWANYNGGNRCFISADIVSENGGGVFKRRSFMVANAEGTDLFYVVFPGVNDVIMLKEIKDEVVAFFRTADNNGNGVVK